ncbi:unnamed protein product [Musa hybrid cultivar]
MRSSRVLRFANVVGIHLLPPSPSKNCNSSSPIPITFLNPPNHRQDLHRPPRLILSQFLPLLYLQENSPENSEAWRFDLLKEEFPFVSLVSPSWS